MIINLGPPVFASNAKGAQFKFAFHADPPGIITFLHFGHIVTETVLATIFIPQSIFSLALSQN